MSQEQSIQEQSSQEQSIQEQSTQEQRNGGHAAASPAETDEEQVRRAREALNPRQETQAGQPQPERPENRKLNIVTGAFGYTGHYIAQMLLSNNEWVETITNHKRQAARNDHDLTLTMDPGRTTQDNPGTAGKIPIRSYPYSFQNPQQLVNALHGCDTLYNTYWVRLAQGPQEFTQAVRNSQILIDAARKAGVRRFVHISAMNPQGTTELPYFRSKARVEQHLRSSGLSYAIIRPGLIFGQDDLFLNNMAWMIRRFPVLAIPGDGNYRVQPVEAVEFARQAVRAGMETSNLVEDAAGPEVHTFNEIVNLLIKHVQAKTRVLHFPHDRALMVNRLAGKLMLDMPLGEDESRTLASDLLVSDKEPTGQVRISEWLASNKFRMGLVQTHQPARNRDGGDPVDSP